MSGAQKIGEFNSKKRLKIKSVVKFSFFNIDYKFTCGVVGPGRVERPTSRLSGVRSNHLSYGPAV